VSGLVAAAPLPAGDGRGEGRGGELDAAQRFRLWSLREEAHRHRPHQAPSVPAQPHPRTNVHKYLALALLFAGLIFVAVALYIPAKAQLAQVLMARAWRHELATGQQIRPWLWADFTPAAKLDFPAQRRSILALSDASGESLAFGPTLMAASAKPGQPGVTVFAAHRDTHFAFLGQL
jgi:hypothetical protein